MNKGTIKNLEDLRRQHEEDNLKWKQENDQLHETLISLTSDCEQKQVEISILRDALAVSDVFQSTSVQKRRDNFAEKVAGRIFEASVVRLLVLPLPGFPGDRRRAEEFAI